MKKYSIVVVAALALASCKKERLDRFPYNQVETTQAFNTEADVTLAVNGMYEGLRASGSYFVNGTWNIMADVLADNVITMQQGRGSLRTYANWQYSGNNTYGLFTGGYSIIRRANAILENMDRFPAGAFKDNAIGEALAMRAMIYFDMSRVYSKTYLNATDQDSTVPYITTTDPLILPSKEPVRGFYEKVIADLNRATTLIGTSNGIFRLNRNAVHGLLSRVNLYKGDWAATIAAANSSVGATPNVADIATFPKIWTDEVNTGLLFKVRNTSVDNINSQGVNYYQAVGTPSQIKSEFVVEYNFFQQFTDADIRKSTYIRTSNYNGIAYNNVIKYAGRPGQPAGVLDAKVLRTAEVLLNRAEANFRSGREGDALADLVLLKSNRYTGYVAEVLTGQDLLNEILKQRRLELAFEGDRFWDLKRRNQPVVRDATKGDRADGTGTPYVFTSLAAGDYRFNLPFPASEVNYNTNLRQNPGY